MPRYFLTKVWGFSPEDYPVLGFTPGGGREKFLREGTADDWVVVAGTRTAPTVEEERGRLLGMMRLGRNDVDVEAVLNELGTPILPEHRHEDGRYRWPAGLPMLEARRFVGRPDLAEIFGNYLPGTEWAAFALSLDDRFSAEVVARVASLPTEPVSVARSSIIAGQVAVHEALSWNRQGQTGPGPSDHRDAVDREVGEGWAYLLRLRGPDDALRGGLPVYKVGRAADVSARVDGLNAGLLSAVTGYRWEAVLDQRFRDEKTAHAFEQALHERLRRYLVDGEREVYRVREGDVTEAWMSVFSRGGWGRG